MSEPIFRQSALERLTSPERLDTLMTVTRPRGWLALCAIALVLGGALVWGVIGRTQETIEGSGILLRRGGLAEIQSTGAGTISAITVRAGDVVAPGAVVARLAQPELERAIAQAEARVQSLQRQSSESGRMITGGRELEIASVDEQIRQSGPTQQHLRDQVAYLRERLIAQQEAVNRGLINRDVPQDTNQEISRLLDAIAGLDALRTQLTARAASSRNQASQGLFAIENQLRAERQQLELLRLQHERTSVIRSEQGGRVVEMLAERGDTLQVGTPLLSIDLPEQELDCLLFVPLSGKEIQPGMAVHVTPAGVHWEEYGYMVGRVREVSRNPLSPAAMNVYLRNPTLVQQFNAQGASYLVYVDLETAPASRRRYKWKWTSGEGPPYDFGGGTLLGGTVTIQEHAPITLVVPALRRWLGV
jgi:HlyD family secretion protein